MDGGCVFLQPYTKWEVVIGICPRLICKMNGQSLISPSPKRESRAVQLGNCAGSSNPTSLTFEFPEDDPTLSEEACNSLLFNNWVSASDSAGCLSYGPASTEKKLKEVGAQYAPPAPAIKFHVSKYQLTLDGYVSSKKPPIGLLSFTRLQYGKSLWKKIKGSSMDLVLTEEHYMHKTFRCNDPKTVEEVRRSGMDFLCVPYTEKCLDITPREDSLTKRAVIQLKWMIDNSLPPPYNADYKTSVGYVVDMIFSIDKPTLLSLEDTIDFSNIYFIEVTLGGVEFEVYGALLASMSEYYDTNISFTVWIFMNTKEEFHKLEVYRVVYKNGIIVEWEHTKYPNTLLPQWKTVSDNMSKEGFLSTVTGPYRFDVLHQTLGGEPDCALIHDPHNA